MAARSRKIAQGFSLIEVMIAMTILVVSSVGVLGLTSQSARMNGDGRRMTRAVALAQDLVSNMELWTYADSRLANSSTANNDADISDELQAFESEGAPPADHGEADLTSNGAVWLGVPYTEIAAGGYERYWNVAEGDDWNGNGIPDLKRIAVIIRWPHGSGFRRVVLFTNKINPADTQ